MDQPNNSHNHQHLNYKTPSGQKLSGASTSSTSISHCYASSSKLSTANKSTFELSPYAVARLTPNSPVLVSVGKGLWPAHVIKLSRDGRTCHVRFDGSGPEGEWVPTQTVQPVEEIAAASRRRVATHHFAPF